MSRAISADGPSRGRHRRASSSKKGRNPAAILGSVRPRAPGSGCPRNSRGSGCPRKEEEDTPVLRFLTAGESHGQALVVIVEGLPALMPITIEEIADELARRRLGYGRGPRMRFERDDVEFLSGVRHGRTLGSPVSIVIRNTEWPKWVEEMSPAPGATQKPLRQPRPGHADLVGMQKYGFDDARDVLERASARETAARVAAGTLAKALLSHLKASVLSHRDPDGFGPGPFRPTPRARRPRGGGRLPGALLRFRRRGGDDRLRGGGGQGRRLPRRGGGGAGLRRPSRPRLARPLGSQDRRPAGSGAHEYPGHEGRGDRRGLRGGGPAGQRGA
jgi:Chorismate synthase